MERFKSLRRVQVRSQETMDVPQLDNDGDDAAQALENVAEGEERRGGYLDLGQFKGMRIPRRASLYRECSDGDYIGVDSDPYLTKILSKQGFQTSTCQAHIYRIEKSDKTVIFADKVLKFTGSGKMKRRILLITDFAIYLVDPDADTLKRRIALAAVDRLCLSKLSDNFFAIIILSEYDLLMASTRREEIVSVLVEATKSTSEELEVVRSNRFEYNASADMVKEVEFVEVDGGIKTRISKKGSQSE